MRKSKKIRNQLYDKHNQGGKAAYHRKVCVFGIGTEFPLQTLIKERMVNELYWRIPQELGLPWNRVCSPFYTFVEFS